jgi:ferritin-like metal-binding protein YciE
MVTMEELFLDEIRDLYDAEKQLTKALPKMAKSASSESLRETFENHLAETRNHVGRLEEIFSRLDQKPTGKKCAAMKGLISEGEDVAGDTDDPAVRDAGIIAAAQKVEHYEISGYGSARTHARILGHLDAVSLLEQTLNEEKQADRKLNELAESGINEQAAGGAASLGTAPTTRTAGGH